MTTPAEQIQTLIDLAKEVDLELRGVIQAEPLDDDVLQRLDQWLQAGCAGEMDYLGNARSVMGDIREWKPWARSVALFALPYHRPAGGFRDGGRVARYAMGRDYHNLLGKRLERLGKRLRARGMAGQFRSCTDAAPLLEREWAINGQLGWRGKNTLVLDPAQGPWVILGELVMDADFPTYFAPRLRTATCGSCVACLDVCPTGALTSAYQMDARLCISYLTIEHRGAIPVELRPLIGDWVFGCDLCLEVCPFGDRAEDHSSSWGTKIAFSRYMLEDLLTLTEQQFDQDFAGSPIRRAGWAGLIRNACVALGNLRRGGAALSKVAQSHPDEMVREHADWALKQLNQAKNS